MKKNFLSTLALSILAFSGLVPSPAGAKVGNNNQVLAREQINQRRVTSSQIIKARPEGLT